MADTEAMLGYGSKYEVLDPSLSPPSYVELAEVFNLTPPSFTADRVEATHMQSPNRTREFIPGLLSPGSASFEMNFIPGSDADALIRQMQQDGVTTTHRITFPNSVTWSYTASIESYEPAAPTDDRMTATVNINVSGNITPGVVT